MRKKLKTKSAAETKRLAQKIARRLRGNEILALQGDLGSGKTTFIQGLAEGLGIKRRVLSPSFVLQRIHRGKKHTLFHYDFYRLKPREVEDLDLAEVWGQGVVAIEWAEKMRAWPPGTILIEIKEKGKNKRELIFHLPPGRDYLWPR